MNFPKANNKEQENIISGLNRLFAGEPLRELSTLFIWKEAAREAIKNLQAHIKSDAKSDAGGARSTTLLVSTFGGGKSQAIYTIQESFKGYKKDLKIAVSDISLDTGSNTARNFQIELFKKLTFLPTSDLLTEINKISKKHYQNNPATHKFAENTLSLGIDITAAIFNITSPGVSILATGIFNWINRKVKFNRSKLKKIIEARGIKNPDSIEFLICWMKYCFGSKRKHWEIFNEKIETFANNNNLIPAVCNILNKLGYKSIILIIDESNVLLNSSSIRDALKGIRATDAMYEHNLNMHFVFAGTEIIETLDDESKYGGFSRRFFDKYQGDICIDKLIQPEVNATNDDVTKVTEKLDLLSTKFIEKNWLSIDSISEQKIRDKLKISKNLSWSRFWNQIRLHLEENNT